MQEPLLVPESLIKVGFAAVVQTMGVYSTIEPAIALSGRVGASEGGKDIIAGAWEELLWMDQLDIGSVGGSAWVLVQSGCGAGGEGE